MIGWSFQIPNKYGQVLMQIFEGIPIEKYIWKLDEDDIYMTLNRISYSLFYSNKLEGEKFKEKISLPSSLYYVVFSKLQAFPTEEDVQELESFGDYFKSNCELVILITDVEFVEIYSKNKDYLATIQKNVAKNGFQKLKPIYKINDWDKEITSR